MFALLGFVAQVCVFLSITAILISCVSLLQSAVVVDVRDDFSDVELAMIADDVLQFMVTTLTDEPDATLPMTTSYCAKSMTTPTIVTTISEFEPYPSDINSMTVKQLKAYAKASGFTGYSALRKAELLALLSQF